MSEAHTAENDAVTWFQTLSEAKDAALAGAEIEVREVYINGMNGSSLHATRYYVSPEGLRVIPPEASREPTS